MGHVGWVCWLLIKVAWEGELPARRIHCWANGQFPGFYSICTSLIFLGSLPSCPRKEIKLDPIWKRRV